MLIPGFIVLHYTVLYFESVPQGVLINRVRMIEPQISRSVIFVLRHFHFLQHSRGSISSYTKISRNSSFRFDQGSLVQSPGNQSLGAGQSKKDQSSVIKKLVNNLKQKSEEEMIYQNNSTNKMQKYIMERIHLTLLTKSHDAYPCYWVFFRCDSITRSRV